MDHNVPLGYPIDADDDPFPLRWSRSKGWIRFRDPVTGEWDEVWSRDVPAWRAILIQRLRDEGRLSLPQVDDVERDGGHDRFRCDCYPEHEPCSFGLGVDCLNGASCTNPHHIPQRVIAP